jgi:hypothetical protein
MIAGLQAGMVGALVMLGWMGVSAVWSRLSFWTAENLFASAFYGTRALNPGFSSRTVSGLALYLVIYSSLGAVFSAAAKLRLPRLRVLLLGILFGICWYYLSFRLLWRGVMPLVALLHPEQPTIVGHVIYGALIGRFPAYIRPELPPPQPVPADATTGPETPEI